MRLLGQLKNSSFNLLNNKTSQALPLIANDGEAERASRKYDAIAKYRSPLSEDTEKEILQYSMMKLGGTQFAPWLRVYSILRGEFVEGWIPDNYFGEHVVTQHKGAYGKLSNLNLLHPLLFKEENFPNKLFYVNEIFFDNNLNIIAENKIQNLLFKDCDRVIFKKDSSLNGLGISIIHNSEFNLDEIKSAGNGTFQTWVEQHSGLSNFVESSVATLRITTVVDSNGEASIRAALLKLGREGDKWIRTSNFILIPINLLNGNLLREGYDSEWNLYYSHPDSNFKFENFQIPSYKRACEIALRLQRKVPFVRTVGWDFAIDKNGEPVVLEWNGGHNGISYSEATTGPCFSDLGWENLWKKST